MLILCMISLALRRNVLNTLTAAQRHWVYAIPPLSSKPRASRMVFKGIMCFALIVFFVSCKSHDVPRMAQMDTDKYESHVLQRVDTVVVRDSVFVSERQRGDTVYLTRTEWRDRWRTRLVHDTVRHTEYVDRVIEQPPERYVPKFYKWCTWLFFILLLGTIGYLVIKIRQKIQ